MPAVVAIPLIIGAASAGSAVASAKIQSNAAKNAAKTQVASQDKAQTFNQQAFQQQQAALQPYISGGQDAFSRLMSQHYGTGGLSAGMQGTAVLPGQGFTPQPPRGAPPQGGPGPLGQAMGGPPMGPQGPQALAAPPGGPQGQPGPLQAAMGQPGGQMVMMVGPDGTQKAIPQANVQEAMRRGARPVQ